MQEKAQQSISNLFDKIMSTLIIPTQVGLGEVQIARHHVNYLIANPLNNSSSEFIAARNYLQQQKVKHFPLPALTYYGAIAKLMITTSIFLHFAHEFVLRRNWPEVSLDIILLVLLDCIENLFQQFYKIPAHIQPYLIKNGFGLSLILKNASDGINSLMSLDSYSFFSYLRRQNFYIDGCPLLRANIENLSPIELKELYINTFSSKTLNIPDVPSIRAEL